MPLIYSEEAGAFIEAPTPLVNVGGVWQDSVGYACKDGVWGQVWPETIVLSLTSDAWTPLYKRTDPVCIVEPTVSFQADGIRFTGRSDDKYNTGNIRWSGIFTKIPYNLSYYSKLCAQIRVWDNISDRYSYVTYTQIGVATQNTEWGYYSIPTGMEAFVQDGDRVTTDPVDLTLIADLTGVTGAGYPYVAHSGAYSKTLIKEIWLEP